MNKTIYKHPTIPVDLTNVADYTVLVNFGKVLDDHTPISLVVASVLGTLGEEVIEIDIDGVMLTVRVNDGLSEELLAELSEAVEVLGCTPENF